MVSTSTLPAQLGKRFELRRQLGAGGVGVVYEAFDRARGERVALKTLKQPDPAGLARFKREFRSLADIVHPNLIRLHELIAEGEDLLFTMELVSGRSYLHWVRDDADAGESALDMQVTAEIVPRDATLPGKRPAAAEVTNVEGPSAAVRVDRLRVALRQLAEGVTAIHRAGMLHRDLKPSNVLVSEDGVVKILDFGLVTETAREGLSPNDEGLSGTVAYMAPEQAAGDPLGPAADWYAVGVMLFQALTGRLPFAGKSEDILVNKQRVDAPAPHPLPREVPLELGALCTALLRRDPGTRAGYSEIVAALGDATPADAADAEVITGRQRRLVGREPHLELLAAAQRETSSGRTRIVYVRGESGSGKTALVRQFLAGEEERGAVVLSGRCYERDAVPFKALDTVIDTLSRYLARLPRVEAEALMPRHIGSLARMFPVLRQVEAIVAAPRPVGEVRDPLEARRMAVAALGELLARIADRHPLIVALDDLQWGDADSAQVMTALFEGAAAPALLLIACSRPDDETSSPFLSVFRPGVAELGATAFALDVGKLTATEAVALAQSILGDASADARARAERMAADSDGNPLFLEQLARHSKADTAPRTLEDILGLRLGSLPPDAARLMDAVAVAGRPIAVASALRAAEADEFGALALLKSAHLVRTRGIGDRRQVECYHDRIRTAAIALLPDERLRHTHHRLALALESAPAPDVVALAFHLDRGGAGERAAAYAEKAAVQADEALAFDRAAELWRMALERPPFARVRQRALQIRLADALANAGRGTEAAPIYAAAAVGADPALALDLRRRAAESLLRSGHIKEGMTIMEEVLDVAGLGAGSGRVGAIASFAWNRARLAMRNLRARRPPAITADATLRVDALYAVASALTMVDGLRSTGLQARGLLSALDLGDPARLQRALAAEACYRALAGAGGGSRSLPVVAEVKRLAEELDTPEAQALVMLAVGVSAHLEGRFDESIAACDRGEQLFRERCAGLVYESKTTEIFLLYSLCVTGGLARLVPLFTEKVRSARQRGDLYTATNLGVTAGYMVALTLDAPARGRQEVDAALARWNPPDPAHIQFLNATCSHVFLDVYEGEHARAYARIADVDRFARNFLFKVETLRVNCAYARAVAALALAGDGDANMLREAKRGVGKLTGERAGYAVALGHMLASGIAVVERDPARAVALCADAERELTAAQMYAHAVAARWARGRILGGEAGRALCTTSEAELAKQGVQAPARFARVWLPVVA